MIIEYKTRKNVTEKKQLEIEDTKNVFLKGNNPYDALPSYFGIWENRNYLVIITITGLRYMNYQYYVNNDISTNIDIKNYLEYNENVKIVTRDEFKEQIQHIKMLLEI